MSSQNEDIEKVIKKIRSYQYSSIRKDPDEEAASYISSTATSGDGHQPTADQWIIFYQQRELEHKDRIYLMQRYFAWSIYGLIFIWLIAVLIFVVLSSIKCSESGCWILNSAIMGGVSAFWGIIIGLSIFLMRKIKPRESGVSQANHLLALENYYSCLLKWLVFGGAVGGTVGFIAGVFLSGCGCPGIITAFEIESNVLIALITSTTAGVLGIFACVMKWLFPSSPEDKRDKKEK